MEKQTLEKIYKFRKITVDLDWKERTKNNILQKDTFLDCSFSNILVNHSLSLVAVFAVFIFFTIPIIGSYQKDYQQTTLFTYQTEKQEVEKMIASEEEQVVVDAEEPKPIQQEFATIEENFQTLEEYYQTISFQVLSTYTGKNSEEDVAEELIAGIERNGAEEMILILGMEEENNSDISDILENMKEAFEEGDYNKVFDIWILKES
ncbi:MAG: hypothetical protein U9P61_01980 [Patescibacteria group bacterium]|nr:hypothetical protein [Patescibacteria group bacterium]